MNIKNIISLFVYPFFINNGKNIEGITQYYQVNMELVKLRRDEILTFFNDYFDLSNEFVRVDSLFTIKDGTEWNYLENLEDLDLIELVVTLGIASGIFIDSFIDRMQSIANMGNYIYYLERDHFDLDDEETLINYLISLRDYVLHYYQFEIDNNVYNKMLKKAN